jgi:hypothetical protein
MYANEIRCLQTYNWKEIFETTWLVEIWREKKELMKALIA